MTEQSMEPTRFLRKPARGRAECGLDVLRSGRYTDTAPQARDKAAARHAPDIVLLMATFVVLNGLGGVGATSSLSPFPCSSLVESGAVPRHALQEYRERL